MLYCLLVHNVCINVIATGCFFHQLLLSQYSRLTCCTAFLGRCKCLACDIGRSATTDTPTSSTFFLISRATVFPVSSLFKHAMAGASASLPQYTAGILSSHAPSSSYPATVACLWGDHSPRQQCVFSCDVYEVESLVSGELLIRFNRVARM